MLLGKYQFFFQQFKFENKNSLTI